MRVLYHNRFHFTITFYENSKKESLGTVIKNIEKITAIFFINSRKALQYYKKHVKINIEWGRIGCFKSRLNFNRLIKNINKIEKTEVTAYGFAKET